MLKIFFKFIKTSKRFFREIYIAFNDWIREKVYFYYFTRKKSLRFYWFLKAYLKKFLKWFKKKYNKIKYEITICKITFLNIKNISRKPQNYKEFRSKRNTYYFYFRSEIWFLSIVMLLSIIICLCFITFLFFQDY